MSETDTFEEGDTVVLADTHHAHNSDLKGYEGSEGTVEVIGSGYNDKYLVRFGEHIDTRYWVGPNWLDKATNTDN